MSVWNFKIRFTTGSTDWDDITDLVRYNSIEKSEQLVGSGGTASTDTLRFTINHESTTTNAIFGADETIEFKVYETTTSYQFTGIIDTEFNQGYGQIVGPIEIEAIDNGYKLDKKIKTSFQYPSTVGGTAYMIFATSSTGESILHPLLKDAGYTAAEISTSGSITDTVQHVAETAEAQTYREFIDGLLEEYGYTYRFDESGTFQTVQMRPTTATYTFASSNIAVTPPLQRTKRSGQEEAVEVEWSVLKERNLTLFTDTAELSDGRWDNTKDLFVDGNYPEGSSDTTIYQNYDMKEAEPPPKPMRRGGNAPT